MYENGRGVPQDPAEAFRWYEKAAQQEWAAAEYNLGGLYSDGLGVKKDLGDAIRWYTRAAEHGVPAGATRVAALYEGEGKVREALTWFKQAGEQGDSEALYNVAVMYANGQGTPPKDAEAYFGATLARALGTGENKAKETRLRDELAAKLAPTAVGRARARATSWLADFEKRRPNDYESSRNR